MMRSMTLGAAGRLALAGFCLAGTTSRGGEELRYRRDVLPILADACFRCHGPAVKKGGLRLDRRDAALAPLAEGAVPIVPGKPEESEVIRRIFSDDDDERMPPLEARKVLDPRQKEMLRRWVAQGAPYQGHWSFQPLAKPERPRAEGNPIDAFIADRLRRERRAKGLTHFQYFRPIRCVDRFENRSDPSPG